jgi:hypothetical protein
MRNQSKDRKRKDPGGAFKPSQREREFSEAVERVFRRYGTDLSAFARDVQRDMRKTQDNGQPNPPVGD